MTIDGDTTAQTVHSWRPSHKIVADKNQDNLAHAEDKFKEIQNAYEILGDQHERAWYDGHKDSILRSGERHQAGGGGGFSGGERPEDEVDLYAYFTAACYNGFGDGPRGFYSVYDQLFQVLAQQEGSPSMPRFGSSTAPWSEVNAFYAEWSNFRSAKTFSWADQYNPASAPNRKVRRAMDQVWDGFNWTRHVCRKMQDARSI
jgi:DnaJ homolog subfamily A member 5